MPYYGPQGPINWMPPTNAEFPPPENPMMSKLAGLMRASQGENDVQRMSQMAAQRLAGLGAQGEYWSQQIQKDPRAALMLADEHGGFGEIENRLRNAQAQGGLSDALGQMQQSGAAPQDIFDFILRSRGEDAAKKYAEGLAGLVPKAPTQRERKLGNGMIQREEFTGGQWVPVGEPGISGGGMSFEIDANGNPVIRTGGAAMLGVSSSSRSNIEVKQIDMQDTLSRLDSIRSSFRPEFQEFGTRFNTKALQARASAGMPLTQEEQSQIAAFASFKASAFENASMILNQLSGAAISESEAARLMQFLPNAGTGVFDGDDPITFKRKLDDFDSSIRSSLERYAKQKGIGLDVVPPRSAPKKPPTFDDLMSMSPGETFVDADGITVRKTDRVDASGEPIFEDVDFFEDVD